MSNPLVFSDLNSLVQVRIEDTPIRLPRDQQQLVDILWETELREHPNWFRGEVFTIREIRQGPERIEFALARTDYAHYLATLRGLIDPQLACQVLYGAAVLRTRDNYLGFGEMGAETTYAGRLQGVGGGISDDDIKDGQVDVAGGVLRELYEETGIPTSPLIPRWLKMGGPYHFVVVLYEAPLAMDLEALTLHYNQFVERLASQGETPEFSRLITLPANPDAVSRFLSDDQRARVDYLDGVLSRLARTTGSDA